MKSRSKLTPSQEILDRINKLGEQIDSFGQRVSDRIGSLERRVDGFNGGLKFCIPTTVLKQPPHYYTATVEYRTVGSIRKKTGHYG
jgi:hypothetical protein